MHIDTTDEALSSMSVDVCASAIPSVKAFANSNVPPIDDTINRRA